MKKDFCVVCGGSGWKVREGERRRCYLCNQEDITFSFLLTFRENATQEAKRGLVSMAIAESLVEMRKQYKTE